MQVLPLSTQGVSIASLPAGSKLGAHKPSQLLRLSRKRTELVMEGIVMFLVLQTVGDQVVRYNMQMRMTGLRGQTKVERIQEGHEPCSGPSTKGLPLTSMNLASLGRTYGTHIV